MNTLHTIAAASLAVLPIALSALATPAVAQLAHPVTGPASGADAAMEHHLGTEYKNLGQRTWVNPILPAATGTEAGPSGDQLLQQRLAGYTRELLDRGGWRNAWVAQAHYAAGEPLLAVAVGAGVTSGSAAAPALPDLPALPRLVAAR